MSTFFAYRDLAGRLVPCDESGHEAVRKIPREEMVLVDVKRPRNLGHHRKLFALLNLIHANQSIYPTLDDLLDAIKVHIGHCTVIRLKDGREVYQPRSISFSQMDQSAFDKFWDRVVDVVTTQIIPGLSRDDLERELLDLVA